MAYLKRPNLQVLHEQVCMLLSTAEPKKRTKDGTYLHQVLPRIILVEDINAEVFQHPYILENLMPGACAIDKAVLFGALLKELADI